MPLQVADLIANAFDVIIALLQPTLSLNSVLFSLLRLELRFALLRCAMPGLLDFKIAFLVHLRTR